LDEAVTLAESALALLAKTADRSEEIKALAAIAVARLRQGQLQLAQEATDKVMHLIMESPPTVFSTLEGYAGAAAVYLALWETEAISDSSKPETTNQKSTIKNLKSNARQACKALHRYARVFPIGQPSAWLWQGLYDWLSGHPGRARRAWQKSLAAARKLNMPYDQGWAHFEIGRHLPRQDPARSSHLNRAAEYFAQAGATYDLARVHHLSDAGSDTRENWNSGTSRK
jgi:tetratricopeptide (TPR) repeat protein